MLEAVDHHRREAAHELVPEGVVGLALAAQAGAVEGHRAHVVDRAGVEVPDVRREEPRPADDLARGRASRSRRRRGRERASTARRGPCARGRRCRPDRPRGRAARPPRSRRSGRSRRSARADRGASPSKTGLSATISSIVCMVDLPVGGPDRGELLGHVDPDRAPRDAAPAPDAAGRAELVDPGAELVREPLAVARPRRRPHAAAVDVRVVHGVARVPAAPSLGALRRARTLTSSTEVQKHVGQTRVQFPQLRHRSAVAAKRGCSTLRASRSRRSNDSTLRPISAIASCVTRSAASTSSAVAGSRHAGPRAPRRRDRSPSRRRTGARSPTSSVSARSNPLSARGPVPIEAQKHVPPGHAAVDGDEERSLAARGVVALDVRALEEHPVLDRDRVQVARADAEERERPLGRRLLDELGPRRRRLAAPARGARARAAASASTSEGRPGYPNRASSSRRSSR